MLLQGSHDVFTADKVFILMQNGQATAIPRGYWVDMDESFADGIHVRIARVTAGQYSNWTVVGCVEAAVAAIVGETVLVQVYGYHDESYYDPLGVGSGLGGLVVSSGVAGAAMAVAGASITSLEEPERVAGACGYNLVATAGLANKPAIIKCM